METKCANAVTLVTFCGVLKLCAALVAAALLVCGALLRDVAPLAGGLSWLTVFCFLLSAALLGWAFVWKDQKK